MHCLRGQQIDLSVMVKSLTIMSSSVPTIIKKYTKKTNSGEKTVNYFFLYS